MSSSAAQTSSGTLRSAFSSRRANGRARAGSLACRRAAGSATARPNTAASSVPRADIASVSSSAVPVLARNAGAVSGGKKLARKRPIDTRASGARNSLHFRSSDPKLAITSTTTPAVTQQDLQRARAITFISRSPGAANCSADRRRRPAA